MSKIIEDRYGDLYKTPGNMQTLKAIGVGGAASAVVSASTLFTSYSIINKMSKTSQSIDNKILRQAINDAFDKSELAKNGVEIVEAQTPKVKSSFWDVISTFKVFFYKNDFQSGLRKAIYENSYSEKKGKILEGTPLAESYKNHVMGVSEKYCRIIENGYNAAFLERNNKIVVNIEQLGASVFHEIGHAINKNQSKFWEVLQKSRNPMMYVIGIIPTIALCKRKKLEGEEPKNPIDKATTFIKNNAGKLTTLAFVPMIAEELKATQRGNKLAKQFLSKDAFKKVKTLNRLSATTYISCAIITGVAATVGSKFRDKIASPKRIG